MAGSYFTYRNVYNDTYVPEHNNDNVCHMYQGCEVLPKETYAEPCLMFRGKCIPHTIQKNVRKIIILHFTIFM